MIIKPQLFKYMLLSTADPHNDDPDAIVCGIPLLALCAARGETLEEILVKLNSFFGHFQKQSVILSTDLLATRYAGLKRGGGQGGIPTSPRHLGS